MTQESPAERLRRLGGVGGQAQRPGPSNPGGGRGPQGSPPGGRAGGGADGGRLPRQPSSGGGQPALSLSQDYLGEGYFDARGNLKPGLVVDEAIKVAEILSKRDGRKELTTAQLRRFFGKARLIEQKLESGQPFESVVVEIHQMQPLAAYAVSKDGGPPRVFKEFIDKNVQWAAKSDKHFKEGFIKHFESVVAYFAYLKPR